MDNKKFKIIFYCSDLKKSNLSSMESRGSSGTISSMLWIAEGLANSGYFVAIINEELKNISYFDRKVLFAGVESKGIREWIEATKSSILICVGVELSLAALKIKEELNPEIWFWHHNPTNTKKSFKNIKEEEIKRHIFVSYNHAIRYVKINPKSIYFTFKKLIIIYNPMDLERIPLNTPQDTNINKNLRIAYIGNTSIAKGYDKFIDLKERIKEFNGGHVEWNVFGNGLYSNENICETSNNGEIILHGAVGREKLYNNMLNMDIIVCGLGGNETFCITAIEAAYMGKKIITNKKGGQIEILNKYKQYIFINKIKTLNDIINICSMKLNEKEQKKFRTYCEERFSKKAVVEKWINLLEYKYTISKNKINLFSIIRSFGIGL